ncbi:hypothetical protein SCLCIDRAFT_207112 [Scleroderma citrinum Foug A]|uniref:Uncharacterized protein n=1 Tax=Scleroderma citrinum Foug A TaxID=1036808 RepID=A0A0C2Z4G3_9AGAM|nr:hypothetical protein SCLCIDRAFT_207112 [Scleroderma citrinum Foug A]
MNFPLPSSNLLTHGIFVEPGIYRLIGGITLVFQGEILVLIVVPMPTWGGLSKERKSGVNRALANKIINTQCCLCDSGRRNTVWGGESMQNLLVHLARDQDHLQLLTTGAFHCRSISARRLGLRPRHHADLHCRYRQTRLFPRPLHIW